MLCRYLRIAVFSITSWILKSTSSFLGQRKKQRAKEAVVGVILLYLRFDNIDCIVFMMIIIPLPPPSQLERFSYITDLCVSYGLDVILTGDRGTGKTSFVNYLLSNRLSISRLPVNHLLTPVNLQSNMIEKLTQIEKKSGQRGSRKSSDRNVFFLDDVHLASKSTLAVSASQTDSGGPLLELIRYMLCQHKLRDFTRTYEHLLSFRFVATTTPEDYWRLPTRLSRTMCRLPFLPPSDECLHQIFSRSISLWLEAFPLQDATQVANVSTLSCQFAMVKCCCC